MITHVNTLAAGWWSWMLPMLWQTALLAAFVWALDFFVLRRRGWPQVRYALWLLVFARLLLPPTFALPTSLTARLLALRRTPSVAVQPRAVPRPAVEDFDLPDLPPTHRATMEPLPVETELPAALAAIRTIPRMPLSAKACAMLASTAVSLFFLGWLLMRVLRLRRLARRAVPVSANEFFTTKDTKDSKNGGTGIRNPAFLRDLRALRGECPADIAEALAHAAKELRLRRLPQVVITDGVPSAAVCGVFRPILFLPAAYRDLPREQLGHILLHELAHLKRRDLLVNAAQTVLHILYWFNPVLWLAGRRLRHLREICCDATVANLLRERTGDYCRTLVDVADRASNENFGPALGLLGLFESPSRLRQRIECLARPAWKHRRLRFIVALVSVAIVVSCVAPMAPIKPAPLRVAADSKKVLPGSELSIQEAWGKATYAVVCEAVGEARRWRQKSAEGKPILFCNQDFEILEHEAGFKVTFKKVMVAYDVIAPEKPVDNGERVIWLIGNTGIKALPDTPENRKAVAEADGGPVVFGSSPALPNKAWPAEVRAYAPCLAVNFAHREEGPSVVATITNRGKDAITKLHGIARFADARKMESHCLIIMDQSLLPGETVTLPVANADELLKVKDLNRALVFEVWEMEIGPADAKASGTEDGVMHSYASARSYPAETNSPEPKPMTYADMLKLYDPDGNSLRLPTAEEIKAIGPLWPSAPPQENAAYYYTLAARLVKQEGVPMGSASAVEPYAGDQAAFAVWIRDNAPAFDALKQGMACKVCAFPPLFNKATNSFEPNIGILARLRQLARTISDAAFLEELDNRPDAAADWYLANIQMGRQMCRGTLIQNLVGIAIESIGTLPLDELVANAELPAPALRRIIEKAREAESSPEEMKDLLAHEELFYIGAPTSVHPELRLARQALQEAMRTLDTPLHVLLAEEAARKASQPAGATEPSNSVPPWVSARTQFGRLDVRLRALQVRAAIVLFQKQAGRPPEKLDELVPAILPSVPLDPFSGKPLRYARTDDGWKVWSVGADLKDNGGVSTGQYPQNLWSGSPDAVFPSKLPSNLERQARRGRTTAPEPNAAGDLFGLTPLHYAANRGDAAEVARLLAAGADVKAKGNCGQMPLHLAGTAAVAKLLLDHGADLNAESNVTGSLGMVGAPATPLGWAVFGDRKDVAELLLDAEAARGVPGYAAALKPAVALDRYDIVMMLVKKGADINRALNYAVGKGNVALAGKLVTAGAVVGGQDLSAALGQRDWVMARFCLDKGAKPDFFAVAALGDLEEARKLIAADPSLVKQVDSKKWTALHWAAFAGRKDMVAFLISKGADVNNKECGETPLHVAAENGQFESQTGALQDAAGILQELLAHGANVDARNAAGQTPLIVAVWHFNLPGVEALLKKGADAKIKDDAGKTALDWAKDTKIEGMIQLLEKYGPNDGRNIPESPPAAPAKPVTYEDMLRLSPDADKVRMPTAEEIKVLGALWPQVPPEENAAYYFAKAVNAIAPKEAIPAGSFSLSEKAYAGDVKAFEKWVELNQPAFKWMRQGFEQKTCRFPIFIPRDTSAPIPDTHVLAGMRYLARTCTDAAFLAELQAKPDAAAEAYADCLRLGVPMRREGVLIEALVGIAVSRIGARYLDMLLANSPLSDEGLKKVILQCRDAEIGAGEPARIWANECAYAEACTKLSKVYKDAGVVVDMWRSQRADVTQIIGKKTLPELLQQKTMQEFSRRGAGRPNEVPDAMGPALARAFEELGRTDVWLKETEIRAALALYQKKHGGALPENLDALVPDILPAVPMDPYSGKPMRYAKTPEGWKLWSVGADNTDNGGQGDPSPVNLWNGPDYVFISKLVSNLERRSAPRPAPEPADTSTQVGLMKLVQDFLANNFHDVTASKTIDWGQREAQENGNVSIRYMYEATIRDKAKSIMNQVFTFNAKGEFVSVDNVKGYPKQPDK